MDRGVVFYAKADGSSIREAIFPLERPNGIGLSPDERTLYVVETPTARCWAFKLSAPGQIESANGPYRGEKGTVVAGLPGYQMFDSLAVDSEGHICVATLITGAVSDIWPDGSRVDQYKLPDMDVGRRQGERFIRKGLRNFPGTGGSAAHHTAQWRIM